MTRIIGCDPGMSGGFAVLEDGALVEIFPTPTMELHNGRRALDASAVMIWLQRHDDCRTLWLEKAQAMPRDGAVGAFAYGKGVGILTGLVLGLSIPLAEITPQDWRRVMGLPNGAGKDASRAMAQKLWPTMAHLFARKKDDGLAEAALIAEAGRRKMGGGTR